MRNIDHHVELCWHCYKSIEHNQYFYSIKESYPGSPVKKEIFFHKSCFVEIAGEDYKFYD